MSVAPERGQWMQDERRFALKPEGRIQTKKLRPVVPVVDLLDAWLRATDEWFIVRESVSFDEHQQINVSEQLKVASIKSAWNGAKAKFGIPEGWGPKLMRHSMATILAKRRVSLIELEIALGHRVLKKTTSRYAFLEPEYMSTISAGIDDVISDLFKKVGPALHPKLTRVHENVVPIRA